MQTEDQISIEEALGKAIDGLEEPQEETKTPGAEEPETPEEAQETEEQPEEEAPEEQEEAEDPEEKEEPDEPEEAPEPTPEDRAPNSWKTGAVAEKWKDLPKEIKSEIHRREADFHKGLEQYREAATMAREMEGAIMPYAHNIKASGVPTTHAINHLLMIEDKLRNGDANTKAQVLVKIAQDYGIDMQQAVTASPADQRMFDLEQKLHQERMARMQYEQSVQAQQETTVQSEIQKFATDPKNEFFEAVKGDMAQLLQTGVAQSLQDAYEKAVWARPDIRQTLVERQRTEAERQAELKTRKKRAQTAAAGVKGSATSQVSKLGKHASIEETVAAVMDGLIQ